MSNIAFWHIIDQSSFCFILKRWIRLKYGSRVVFSRKAWTIVSWQCHYLGSGWSWIQYRVLLYRKTSSWNQVGMMSSKGVLDFMQAMASYEIEIRSQGQSAVVESKKVNSPGMYHKMMGYKILLFDDIISCKMAALILLSALWYFSMASFHNSLKHVTSLCTSQSFIAFLRSGWVKNR